GLAQCWAALEENPHLVAISPMCSGDDEYLDRYYSPGGALKLGHRLLWLTQNVSPHLTSPASARPRFATYIEHLPLRNLDVVATGAPLSLWRGALDHPSYDEYWDKRSVREESRRVNVPVLSFGGWFDNYAESDLDAFSRISVQHVPVETWIGPWAHNPGLRFATRDFGEDAHLAIRAKQADWFDRWVRKTAARDDEAGAKPLLHIFVMGPNVWRDEHEWPLARTRYTPLYVTSKGHANSISGDGVLEWTATTPKSHPDQFVYDPRNPVPTTGGAVCCDPNLLPPGPLNQELVEQRPDVLVYTSPPLTQPLEVTGAVRVQLYVATSANDTDFTAKLVDVQPAGSPLLVTDGIQRLRYRLSLQHPVFVKRNVPYQVNVDAGVTSYVFAAGHRIRLEISSSNFPRFDRNLNAAGPNADQMKIQKARQTVFHDERYPSAIILPLIPRDDAEDAAVGHPDHADHMAVNPAPRKSHPQQ
ncbi:MAG: CocE/NonD family hydrolase, partial [Acidobacteriaceae bacterium]|nr:CocE/NonD family hydrolase [Acidobacteriaceae bacterium]